MMNNKGMSVWVSYVLLTGLIVVIGFGVLSWSQRETQIAVSDVVERGDALSACESISIQIDNLCQDTQTLNMDITNSGRVTVKEVLARMFTVFDEAQAHSRVVDISPQRTKSISLIKEGTLQQAEIVPVVVVDNRNVRCESRVVEYTAVPIC